MIPILVFILIIFTIFFALRMAYFEDSYKEQKNRADLIEAQINYSEYIAYLERKQSCATTEPTDS